MGSTACPGERRPRGTATDGIVHPFRCSGICAAHRVREYCQSSSSALFWKEARNCYSVDDGCESRTPGSPTVDREQALVSHFRCSRSTYSSSLEKCDHQSRSRGYSTAQRGRRQRRGAFFRVSDL